MKKEFKVIDSRMNNPFKEDIVQMLEVLIQRAKNGELLSGMFIFETTDRTVDMSWTRCEDRFKYLSFLDRLKYRINTQMDSDEE